MNRKVLAILVIGCCGLIVTAVWWAKLSVANLGSGEKPINDESLPNQISLTLHHGDDYELRVCAKPNGNGSIMWMKSISMHDNHGRRVWQQPCFLDFSSVVTEFNHSKFAIAWRDDGRIGFAQILSGLGVYAVDLHRDVTGTRDTYFYPRPGSQYFSPTSVLKSRLEEAQVAELLKKPRKIERMYWRNGDWHVDLCFGRQNRFTFIQTDDISKCTLVVPTNWFEEGVRP